jgi:hypothetical protein
MNFYSYVLNNPINWKDPFGLAMWYDDLSSWAMNVSNQAKDALFGAAGGNRTAAYYAAGYASAVDLVMGIFNIPAAIGHLGEGTGCFIAKPSWERAPGMLMDISLAASILAGIGSQLNKPYYQYYPKGNMNYSSKYLTRGRGGPPYKLGSEAVKKLSLPEYNPGTAVKEVKVNPFTYVRGPGVVKPANGQPGQGIEYILP